MEVDDIATYILLHANPRGWPVMTRVCRRLRALVAKLYTAEMEAMVYRVMSTNGYYDRWLLYRIKLGRERQPSRCDDMICAAAAKLRVCDAGDASLTATEFRLLPKSHPVLRKAYLLDMLMWAYASQYTPASRLAYYSVTGPLPNTVADMRSVDYWHSVVYPVEVVGYACKKRLGIFATWKAGILPAIHYTLQTYVLTPDSRLADIRVLQYPDGDICEWCPAWAYVCYRISLVGWDLLDGELSDRVRVTWDELVAGARQLAPADVREVVATPISANKMNWRSTLWMFRMLHEHRVYATAGAVRRHPSLIARSAK